MNRVLKGKRTQGAQRKWQHRHQRNVRDQGRPPLEACQLAMGEEWWGCSVISIKVKVSQGQGEGDERERGRGRGEGVGESIGRTTPDEGTLQEGGGAHALLTQVGKWKRVLEELHS